MEPEKSTIPQKDIVQLEEQNVVIYKTTNRRWLLLGFVVIIDATNFLYKARYPLIDTIYAHWNTNVDEVTSWSILELLITAVLLLPLGRAIDHYGIKLVVSYHFSNPNIGIE